MLANTLLNNHSNNRKTSTTASPSRRNKDNFHPPIARQFQPNRSESYLFFPPLNNNELSHLPFSLPYPSLPGE